MLARGSFKRRIGKGKPVAGNPKSLLNREKQIFEQALDLASLQERAAFLKGACGADAALLERLLGLLRASENVDAFLPETPQTGETIKLHLPENSGETIGSRIRHYKLLQKVGEGGCGVVYMAEQEEPVRRRVALKVIKLGMDTRAVVARFEAERQALAMMDHPNIARVLDAGTTDQGRPYFVMELVRGIRITDYCDQNHRLLRSEQAFHRGTPQAFHSGLSRHPARPPKRHHPPGHQTI